MTKISALIIAHNEQQHIGRCIDSLSSVVDEVIVVDSFSTDDTEAISQSKGARVVQKEFMGFGAQKNYGASLAANDYILSMDADEALSDTLRRSLLALKQTTISGNHYVKRLNHIAGQPIRSCGWYPDIRTRLYDRTRAKWDDKEVHEELIVKEEAKYINGDLLHYSYEDYEDMKHRTDRYAKMGAQMYRSKSKPWLIMKMLLNPVAKFIKTYLMQGGIADGNAGWMISRYKARETFLKYYLALG